MENVLVLFGQITHSEERNSLEYVPRGQGEHGDSPIFCEKYPGLHGYKHSVMSLDPTLAVVVSDGHVYRKKKRKNIKKNFSFKKNAMQLPSKRMPFETADTRQTRIESKAQDRNQARKWKQ